MFNPEMMKKYSEVGVKVQQLQEELQQTEIECSTGEGAIVIKMRGLPYSATETEIANFFSGMRISPGGVSIGRDASGRAGSVMSQAVGTCSVPGKPKSGNFHF